jgi:thymidylate synthase (FAD)
MENKLAQIVAYTVPVADITSEDFIVWVARISNPSNQEDLSTGKRLIKYLIRKKHWSPLEMVDVVMSINVTRDIARQALRHRFSFQEWSQRYATVHELGFVTSEARLQDEKNRQSSIEIDPLSPLSQEWNRLQDELLSKVREVYEWALGEGIAKEVARKVLPEGLTMSRMYMKGSIRSWIHYCQVRMDPSTQKEHRELAEACWEELRRVYPTIINAVEEYNTK